MHSLLRTRAFVCVVCLVLAACGRTPADDRPAASAPAASLPSGPPSAPPADDSGLPKIVALGDSLTAGYGLLEQQAFPALLQAKLNAEGYKWEVVNAGISGDTSASGLQRINWALGQHDVRILILELGANDGLRGLPVSEMKKNLAGIIEAARAKGIAVLLVGMEAPPNFGPEYTVSFRQAYRDLAREHKVAFLPFLLDRVAGDAALNQGDGIHPNVAGTAIVAETVWQALRPLIDAASSSSSGGLRPAEPPGAVPPSREALRRDLAEARRAQAGARGGPKPRFRLRQGYGGRAEAPSARRRAAPAAHSLRSFATS